MQRLTLDTLGGKQKALRLRHRGFRIWTADAEAVWGSPTERPQWIFSVYLPHVALGGDCRSELSHTGNELFLSASLPPQESFPLSGTLHPTYLSSYSQNKLLHPLSN